jgi:RNA-directed DNA polymerase
MALDGLEHELYSAYRTRQTYLGKTRWSNRQGLKNRKVMYIRYADDFIITGISKEFLEEEVKPLVQEFLAKRGLHLSEEKTKITHIEEGFDFLGMMIRKQGGKVIIKPSKKSVENILRKLREIIRKNKATSAYDLTLMLNPVIRGWANHFRHVCSKRIFAKIDHNLWESVARWAYRRHPEKGRKWVIDKYFRTIGSRHWVFFGKDKEGRTVDLVNASSTPIRRHIKILGEANPYEPSWEEYLSKRSSKGTLLPERRPVTSV